MSEFFQPSSYHFSWFAVPVIAVGGANWLLGLLTLRRERGSPPSLTLLAMTFVIGIWLLGLGGANASQSAGVATTWVKFSLLGTVFVPVCAFTHAALGSSRLHLLRLFATLGVGFSSVLAGLVLTTHLVLDHSHRYFWGYYPVYGSLGPVLIAYYGLFFVGGGILYRIGGQRTKSVTQQKRMKVRLAALAMALPATVDFLPTMHVGVYPFGYAFILGYVALSTFTIWRYRLVDITPALAATQVLETMSEGLLVVDRDGVVRVANRAAEAVWDLEKSAVGLFASALDAGGHHDILARLMDPEAESRAELTYRRRDGSQHAVVVSSSKLTDHLGAWVGTVFIIHDITERWQAEAAVRGSEERFRSLVQNASDLITVIDPDTTVRYQSPAIQRMLGYDPDAVVGLKLLDVVHRDDRARFLASLGDVMAKPDNVITGHGRVRDGGGQWRHLEFTGADQRTNPSIGGLVLNVRDVTERKRLEDELRHQALHDPLTRLANRTRFADRLEHALLRRRRSREFVAVLFMDLDNFKGVNDGLGHSAGDSLLIQVAERVQSCVRPADTVARLGGDEFAILVEGISSLGEATAVADRIAESLEAPFNLEGKDIVVRASLGIATNQAGEAYDADRLIRDADIAMYVAKSQGKSCYRIFESTMQVSIMERLELLADLPRAVEREELVLYYQPIHALKTGQLYGVEALVRWRHPRRGLLQPLEFIPLAEESGAILSIGSWVLSEACRQAAAWQTKFGTGADWTISVNVSVKQLQNASFVNEVDEALRTSGLAPRRLVLEITESVMMQDAPSTLKRLSELKALGVGLAVDDFGTGYSSLSYLREFPFDLLKIDRSFIEGLGLRVDQKELTQAIIDLGKTLDLELVAEGIERAEQLGRLQAMNCDLGQGFYFAEPMEGASVDSVLATLIEASDAA